MIKPAESAYLSLPTATTIALLGGMWCQQVFNWYFYLQSQTFQKWFPPNSEYNITREYIWLGYIYGLWFLAAWRVKLGLLSMAYNQTQFWPDICHSFEKAQHISFLKCLEFSKRVSTFHTFSPTSPYPFIVYSMKTSLFWWYNAIAACFKFFLTITVS